MFFFDCNEGGCVEASVSVDEGEVAVGHFGESKSESSVICLGEDAQKIPGRILDTV